MRLELLLPDKRASVTDFNSIKVRLEPLPFVSAALYLLFQFHKGAIRTKQIIVHNLLQLLFQFHKGAIRTTKANGKGRAAPISIP